MAQGGCHIRFTAVTAVATVVFLLSLSTPLNAQPAVDWQFGLTQAALSDLHQPWAIGPAFGAGIALPVAEQIRLRLGFSWRRLWDDQLSDNTIKFPRPDSRAGRAWTQTQLLVQAEHLLGGPESMALFGSAGLGVSFWDIESYPGYDPITITDGDGHPTDYSATEAIFSLGVGIQPHLVSSLRLRAQVGVDYFTSLGTDFADEWNNERSRAQLWLTVGVALPLSRKAGAPVAQSTSVTAVPTFAPDSSATATAPKTTAPATAAPEIAADTDNDGVPDPKDQCPGTPVGAIVDRHGCPLDADHDGVYDGLDRCPGTAPSLRAYVDSLGCASADAVPSIPLEKKTVIVSASVPEDTTAAPPAPPADATTAPAGGEDTVVTAAAPIDTTDEQAESIAAAEPPAETSDTASAEANRPPSLTIGSTRVDSTQVDSTQVDADNDGIPDAHDWCPNTLKGLSVDRHGCLIMTQLQRRLILHVSYVPGTTAPDATSLAVLDDLIVRLKREPEVQVTVEGFTDNIGLEADNLAVSQKRADRIKAYLVKQGIATARITAIGRGEVDFIADNDTAAGRQKNRRIEISFSRP